VVQLELQGRSAGGGTGPEEKGTGVGKTTSISVRKERSTPDDAPLVLPGGKGRFGGGVG